MQLHFLTKNRETIDQVNDFINEWNSSSTSIYTNTSGSTGKPKTIELRKEHMLASARATVSFLGLSVKQKALLVLSPQTIGGKMMIVRSILTGMELYIGDVTTNPLKETNHAFDFVAMVPMQLQRVLEETPEKLSSIQQLIIGGGPMSNSLIEAVQSSSTRIYHTFGMTETISHIALKSINHPQKKTYELLPGVSIETDNDRLVINWPEIGVNQLKTNDIVSIENNGFSWLGRADFVINSGGIKLHPEHIEAQLGQLLSSSFFSAGVPDALLGERHIICIEGAPLKLQKSDFTPYLSKYETPKELIYIEQFQYTNSGKINRLETLKTIDTHGTRQVL